MRSIYFALSFLIVGFVLGWLGRSYDIDRALSESVQEAVSVPMAGSGLPDDAERDSKLSSSEAELSNEVEQSAPNDKNNPFLDQTSPRASKPEVRDLVGTGIAEKSEIDPEKLFKQYLDQKAFENAVDLYREMDLAGDASVAQLRAQVISRLNRYIEIGDGDSFTELANGFLSVYYNDIDVLLLLAEFNQGMNYFIEALSVYQMANEYAYTSMNTQKVNEAFTSFLNNVDAYYSKLQSWYMLRQIYERAEQVGMLNPDQRIRLAQIYGVTGDVYSGQVILEDLVARGQSASKASEVLRSLNTGSPQTTPANFEGSVALKQYGNQFAAELALPDQYNKVNLLLDTGASLTTLSTSAFNQLSDHSQYTRLGSRMFHTANGVAMGSVYRFKQVQLGRFILQNVDIAVLDFAMSGDVQGLLGMNILGQFKFHIDQKASRLELNSLQ